MNRFIMRVILSALLVLGFVGSAYAGSGKVYIPKLALTGSWETGLSFSSISTDPIMVTLWLYDENGVLIQDTGSPSSGVMVASYSFYDYIEYQPGVESKTVSFWLDPNQSAVMLITGGGNVGYGVIEWSGCANGYGLVANGSFRNTAVGTSSTYALTINGGNPF